MRDVSEDGARDSAADQPEPKHPSRAGRTHERNPFFPADRPRSARALEDTRRRERTAGCVGSFGGHESRPAAALTESLDAERRCIELRIEIAPGKEREAQHRAGCGIKRSKSGNAAVKQRVDRVAGADRLNGVCPRTEAGIQKAAE